VGIRSARYQTKCVSLAERGPVMPGRQIRVCVPRLRVELQSLVDLQSGESSNVSPPNEVSGSVALG